jgi:hypothetical protein
MQTRNRFNWRAAPLYVAACTLIGMPIAGAQHDGLSPYVRLLVGYAGSAATAAACGDRPSLCGVSVHTQLLNIISRHAGSPIQNSHTPSDDERGAAVTALAKSEDAGAKQGGRPAACRIVRTLYLDEFDQFEAGRKSFWPTSLVPDPDMAERPAMI